MIDDKNDPIPIIFRPFHEFDGNWFWWGKNYCTREEFVELWRTTVDYLREKKNVRNFLYAFSSDRKFENEEEYLDRYPGDEYVDIFGVDDYYDFKLNGDSSISVPQKKLKIISAIAEKKQKLAAFTETGSEMILDSTWWTQKLYKVMDDDSVKIAYVLLWRNLHQGHFYVPYRGHPSEKDFIEFRKKPKMMFESDLPDMYRTVILTDIIAELLEDKK
jgi:mannan endo-1,4-beta-mannosidase